MIDALLKTWTIFDSTARRRFGILFLLMTIGAILEAGGIGAVYPILESLFITEGAKTSAVTTYILGLAGNFDLGSPLATLCWMAFAIILLKNVFLVFTLRFQQNFVWQNWALLAGRLFEYYIHNPYPFHLERNSANLLRNVTYGVTDILIRLVLPAVSLATELLVVCSVTVLLALMAPQETLIALLALVAIASTYYLLVRKHLLSWATQSYSANEQMLSWVNQGLGGIKETKAMGCETFFSDSFSRSILSLAAFRQRIAFVGQLPRYVGETLLVGAILFAIIFFLPDENEASSYLPVIGVFSMAVFRLLPSFNRITGALSTMRVGIPAISKVFDDIQSGKQHLSELQTSGTSSLKFEDEILFEDVSFRYENSELIALQGIDIKIQCGQSVGIVGASGAGKTTLVDILLGLLVPISGNLSVDGVPISSILDQWRLNVGYIPQDIFLIDDTLRKNIAFGLSDDEINNDTITQAVEQAHLADFVASLPDGLETTVGERGVRLSGGQRQRIGIARALYRKASVLIMDEATSSLDAETEAEISQAINDLHGAQTVIIIAHRLSTVKQCDVIYFMEKGRVVDSGTFQELVNGNAKFRQMAEHMNLTLDA